MRWLAAALALWAIVMVGSGCAFYETPPAYGHAPPRVVTVTPEFLYIIPSFGVYFVPDIRAEVFFVDGRWYYRAAGVWYWGTSYRGPWTYIEVRFVPRYLRKLPRDYRERYRHEYYRVPYGHWQKRRESRPPLMRQDPPDYVYRYPKGKIYIHPENPDVVFYDGWWYRRYRGVWYWGRSHSGPWEHQDIRFLPKAVRGLPPGYRDDERRREYKHVPWEKIRKKHRWKEEREREYDRDDRGDRKERGKGNGSPWRNRDDD